MVPHCDSACACVRMRNEKETRFGSTTWHQLDLGGRGLDFGSSLCLFPRKSDEDDDEPSGWEEMLHVTNVEPDHCRINEHHS